MPSRNNSQPGLFASPSSAAERDRKRFAAGWSVAARAFADRCIEAWNQAFKSHGVRANRVRRNHFAAVQLYRWLSSPDNTGSASLQVCPDNAGSASLPACAPMTEADVFAAIRLYAEDPYNAKHCNGRYQDFHSWMSGCPDNVDKQLARCGRRRGSKPADPKAGAARDYAEQLLGPPMNLGQLARAASQTGFQLAQYVRDGLDSLRRGVGARVSLADPDRTKRLDQAAINHYSAVHSLIERFEAASMDDRRRFAERAKRGVAALAVAPGRPLEGPNLRYALALALFSREGKAPALPPAVSAQSSPCGTGPPTGRSVAPAISRCKESML